MSNMYLPGAIRDTIDDARIDTAEFIEWSQRLHEKLDEAGADPCKYADYIDKVARGFFECRLDIDRAAEVMIGFIEKLNRLKSTAL